MLDLLHSVLELHRNHARDAGDTITMAFEAGSYTQARRLCAAGICNGDMPDLCRVVLLASAYSFDIVGVSVRWSACPPYACNSLEHMDACVVQRCFWALNPSAASSRGRPKALGWQVLDFVALKERLERSHTRAAARAESAVYRVQVAASGAVTKGDFAGARLAALEALSDLQQPPDAAQVWVLATAKPPAKTLPSSLATALVSCHPTCCGASPAVRDSDSAQNSAGERTSSSRLKLAAVLLQAADAAALRFNADTATLPPWLPPYTSAPGLASAEWWQYHSGARQSGAAASSKAVASRRGHKHGCSSGRGGCLI